ncbi:hypothetical protein D8Y23_06785 [Microbacterium enclense]|uniref:DUF3137 domain-containing protein n=1 Tax=Microbacterium enclense TaxID=993073 RepID=A0A3S3P5F4_9MICO|nr:hypothetical protein [Microbacterium enclense]RWR19949.1 hypothetical protein D8Y23_06785 [Microbacterium enclense]
MSGIALDTSALTEPVSRADVRAFTAKLRREGKLTSIVVTAVGIVVIGGILLVAAVLMASVVSFGLLADNGRPSPIGIGFLLFFVAVIALVAYTLVVLFRGRATRRYRLAHFAAANGLTWIPAVSSPDLPGMIFALGRDREATDVVRGSLGRPLAVANYSYKTGSGKNEQTHKWAYVELRLDTPLPHIVLDAVGNNGLFGMSNLPTTFGRDQRLSLEGDFDRYFALYCPRGYERDALYLFTPDVMARFIDNAAAVDVEIVDDRLYLYARRELSTTDPAVWEWIAQTVDAIDDKLGQWARWRDERLAAEAAGAAAPPVSASGSASPVPLLTPPPVGVAREGRRLRRGFSWITAVFIVLGVGWWLLTIVFDVIGR